MNLILALVWLLLGVTVLVWQALSGNPGLSLPVGSFRLSYGWLMLLFAAYRLSRWWAVRNGRARRRVQPGSMLRRPGRRWDEERTPHEAPDPNLNFADEPQPALRTEPPGGPAPPG
jgi:hypothetical protein